MPIHIILKAEKVYTFESFQDWVNNARKQIGYFTEAEKIICIDKNGFACNIGEQFMHARDNDLFPITAYRLIKNTESLCTSK